MSSQRSFKRKTWRKRKARKRWMWERRERWDIREMREGKLSIKGIERI